MGRAPPPPAVEAATDPRRHPAGRRPRRSRPPRDRVRKTGRRRGRHSAAAYAYDTAGADAATVSSWGRGAAQAAERHARAAGASARGAAAGAHRRAGDARASREHATHSRDADGRMLREAEEEGRGRASAARSAEEGVAARSGVLATARDVRTAVRRQARAPVLVVGSER